MAKALFPLGRTVATPGALELIDRSNTNPSRLIDKHASGDWGDALCESDGEQNDQAVTNGNRIMSAYTVGDGKVWIITEHDRSSTTILLPSEY